MSDLDQHQAGNSYRPQAIRDTETSKGNPTTNKSKRKNMAHSPLSDEDIRQYCKDSYEIDDKFFTLVYNWAHRQVYPLIRQIITKGGGEEDDINDVYHDSLLMFRKLMKIDYSWEGELKKLLTVIATRKWSKTVKKKIKQFTRTSPLDEISESQMLEKPNLFLIDQMLEKQEQWETICNYLDQIDKQLRSGILLFHYFGFSHKEIYWVLGYANANTFKSSLSRILKKLREIIK